MIGHPEVVGTPALIEFVHEMVASWDLRNGEPCEVGITRGADNARLVYGFAAHSADLGRAVATLYEAGLGYTALRLIRGAIECGVSAAWLALKPIETNRLLYTASMAAQTILAEVKQFGLAGPEIMGMIEENDESLKLLLAEGPLTEVSLQERFIALKGGSRYFVAYRQASALSHPTAYLSEQYFEQVAPSADTPTGLIIGSGPKNDQSVEKWLGQMACTMVIAQVAYESILVSGTRMDYLIEQANRVGIDGRLEIHRTRRQRNAATGN